MFALSLDHLCNPANCGYTKFKSKTVLPVFLNGPHRVWGLTAIILEQVLLVVVPQNYKCSRHRVWLLVHWLKYSLLTIRILSLRTESVFLGRLLNYWRNQTVCSYRGKLITSTFEAIKWILVWLPIETNWTQSNKLNLFELKPWLLWIELTPTSNYVQFCWIVFH